MRSREEMLELIRRSEDAPESSLVVEQLEPWFARNERPLSMFTEEEIHEAIASEYGHKESALQAWKADRDATYQKLVSALAAQEDLLSLFNIGTREWSEESFITAAREALEEIRSARRRNEPVGEALPRLQLRAYLWAMGHEVSNENADVDELAELVLDESSGQKKKATFKRVSRSGEI